MYHVLLALQCIYGVMDAVMEKVKKGMGMRRVRFQEEEREWRLPGLMYADDLILCGESEEDLRAMVGHFVEVQVKAREKLYLEEAQVLTEDSSNSIMNITYEMPLNLTRITTCSCSTDISRKVREHKLNVKVNF